MSPIYAYWCDTCQKDTDEYVTSITNRPKSVQCRYCLGTANYQVSSSNFTVNGANAANRYSSDSNFGWLGAKRKDES